MLSLAIPTLNEQGNIAPLVTRIEAALRSAGEPFEVLIVDDGSKDGTRATVLSLQADNRPWLRLVARDAERDLSTAVVAGWRVAQGEVLGCMDADLQHPPELLPELLTSLKRSPADLVLATRYIAGGGVGNWRVFRRLGSRGASAITNLLLPGVLTGVTDPMSGFFLVRRGAARLDQLRPRGYKILLEVLARARPPRVREVPFTFGERGSGASKADFKVTVQFLRQVLSLTRSIGELRRMVQFGLVGLSGVGVNYLVFWALHRITPHTTLTAAVASACAIVTNFFGNEFYTFRDAAQAATGQPRWHRFARFAGLSLAGLVINTGAVTLLVHALPWAAALAIGILLASTWNFFSNSKLTWRRPPARAHEPAAMGAAPH